MGMEGSLQDQYTDPDFDGGVSALVSACGNLFSDDSSDVKKLAKKVVSDSCLGMEPINTSAFHAVWNEYEREAILKTPVHSGVPYVTVNDKSLDNPMSDLTSTVCTLLGKDTSSTIPACQEQEEQSGGHYHRIIKYFLDF